MSGIHLFRTIGLHKTKTSPWSTSGNAENMTTNLVDYRQENNTLCQPSFSSVLRPIGGCFNATVPVQNQKQAKNLEKNSVASKGMYSYTQLSDLKPKGQFSIIGIVTSVTRSATHTRTGEFFAKIKVTDWSNLRGFLLNMFSKNRHDCLSDSALYKVMIFRDITVQVVYSSSINGSRPSYNQRWTMYDPEIEQYTSPIRDVTVEEEFETL
ncbi:hypothetical protein C8Q75DRAFT_811784 [Abortiporus biennis]|nr:hypothetical protein C8Q75DRAFT_811784 [Abortiporus biennis]